MFCKKFYFVFIIAVCVAASSSPAECARKSNNTAKTAANTSVGMNTLIGTWTGSGRGTGTDPRQPGAVIPMEAEDVIFTVEGFKFSGVAGDETADVIFKCRILDTRGNIKALRTWEYATPYDLKTEGANTWSFSSEFLDGEDKVTVTLTSRNTAKIRLQCSDWNGDYADEISTFDITCEAEKNNPLPETRGLYSYS